MPVVHHPTRRTAAAGATLALALAGLVAPAMSASAAEALAISPATPAAGSAFEVKATSLTKDVAYSLVLTPPGDSNRTNVAEATTCETAADGLSKTCSVREDTAGVYELKLLNPQNVIMARQNVTVATPVAITSATGPVANDNAGANDSITITHIRGVQWATSLDGTTWTNVTFANDAAPGVRQDVPVATANPNTDVRVRATALDGYVFPAGAPSYTLRLTNAATPPAALTIPPASQPVKTDAVGTGNDRLTLTKIEHVDWYVAGTKVEFGANETSKTIAVTPKKEDDFVVKVQARAVAPHSFSGGRLAEDFDQTYSDTKAEPANERVAGQNREQTAVEISKKYFGPDADALFVANGYNFPDALSAGPAAARAKAPLLLSGNTWISDATVEEARRLTPQRIFIVGGVDVVSTTVEGRLAQVAPVTRLAGGNRYATADNVAGQWAGASVAYVAYGLNFPDALSGGSGAAKEGGPLLLSDGAGLSEGTAATLRRLNPAKIVLVGGPTVLGTSVERSVKDVLPNASVIRAAGTDRFDTSALIMKNATGKDGQKTAFLATGRNYPDALAGVPAAAKVNAPLALTQPTCVPSTVKAALDTLPLETVVRLGGPDVIGNFSLVSGVCS